ncbi:MAG: hypothetical protein GYA55_02210, partial [SAR324 cluster bacterium]|nr:hypothetical protein [SAR324 cluster bacterium]
NVDYISRKHLYHRSVILGLAAREVVGVLAANGLVPYEAQLNAAKLGLKYHLGDFAGRLISGDEKPFHLSNDPRRTDIYHRLVDLGVDKKIAYASAYIPKGAAKYADFLRSTETGKVVALPDELKASLVCLPQDGLKSKWKELNELLVSTIDHMLYPSVEDLISDGQVAPVSSDPEFYCMTPTEGLVPSILNTKSWGFVKDEYDGSIGIRDSYSPESLNGNSISSLIDVSAYISRATCDLMKIALDPGSSVDSEVFMRDFVYDCLK